MAQLLEQWVSRLAARLAALPRDRFGMFFAYVAERFMPLYVAFERKHRWGDAAAFRRQLDSVWSALDGEPIKLQQNELELLEEITPSGESFDSPDSTYAQDAVIALDAAVRALMPHIELDGNWLEYALEPVKTKVSIEQTGFSTIEDEASGDWEARLMADPRMAAFTRDYERLITMLETPAPLSAGDLRDEARRDAVRADEYVRMR